MDAVDIDIAHFVLSSFIYPYNIGRCMDAVEIDIAQFVLSRLSLQDKYSVPRLIALFTHFELKGSVGVAALQFVMKQPNHVKSVDPDAQKYCVIEILAQSDCFPDSFDWLLSLRPEIKRKFGGLCLSEWDSCFMEQMFVWVANTPNLETPNLEGLQDLRGITLEEVCAKLAPIYCGEEDRTPLTNLYRRGLIFVFKNLDKNVLFIQFCLIALVNGLSDEDRVFLAFHVEVLLGPSRLGLGLRLMCEPPEESVLKEIEALRVALDPSRSKPCISPLFPAAAEPRHSQRSARPPTSSVTKQKREHGHLVCKHKKRKSMCSVCKGGSICPHGKQRHWCKDCGGRARCTHGKQKSRCADCGGKGICEHQRLRWRCTLCNKK